MTNAKLANIVEHFTKIAPTLLLGIAGLTFIGVSIFHTNFYAAVFLSRFGEIGSLCFAIFLALIHEFTRFALLVSSIRDFSDKRVGNGWLGLIGSLALVAYDIKISSYVANLWANESFDAAIYSSTIIFLILLGLLLEIRLILTVEKPIKRKTTKNGVGSHQNGTAIQLV